MDYLLENPNLVRESFQTSNIGMAKRNGKPWIVILDNGWNGNTAKLYDQFDFGELNV